MKKKNKQWIVDGYYTDGNGDSWTLFIHASNRRKRKKMKGIL